MQAKYSKFKNYKQGIASTLSLGLEMFASDQLNPTTYFLLLINNWRSQIISSSFTFFCTWSKDELAVNLAAIGMQSFTIYLRSRSDPGIIWSSNGLKCRQTKWASCVDKMFALCDTQLPYKLWQTFFHGLAASLLEPAQSHLFYVNIHSSRGHCNIFVILINMFTF